jgi:hypothetical protein
MTGDDYRERARGFASLPSVARQLDKPKAAAIWLTHIDGMGAKRHATGVNVRPARDESLGIVLTVDDAAARERSGSDGLTHRLAVLDLTECIVCDGCGRERNVLPVDLLPALAAYVRHNRNGDQYTHELMWHK